MSIQGSQMSSSSREGYAEKAGGDGQNTKTRGGRELLNRCSLEAVLEARERKCCRKRCLKTFSVDQMLADRRAFASVGGRPRTRQERADYLWKFCIMQGMIRRASAEKGVFRPMLYNKTICWDGLGGYLGVGNNLLEEVRKMAECGREVVAVRYGTRNPAANTVRVHICEFISQIFRRIGEYQPDRGSIILPFHSMPALLSYLKQKWDDQFDSALFPAPRTIRRYMRRDLKFIEREPPSTGGSSLLPLCDFESMTQDGSQNVRQDTRQQDDKVDSKHLNDDKKASLLRVCLRRTQRFGKCLDCVESQMALSRSQCPSDRRELLNRFNLHLESVMRQRLKYYRLKMQALADPDSLLTIIADGPDQYLTRLPHMVWDRSLPKFDDSALVKVKLELVLCHGRRNGPNTFLYIAPPDKSHGSNMVIEALERTFATLQSNNDMPRTGHVHVQLDNPTGENKNRFVFGFLAEKVAEGLITTADIGFLPPSHTHEDIDMRHSQYGRYLRSKKFVNAVEICNLVEECLSGYESKDPSKSDLKRRRVLDTPMHRESLRTKASTMYHIRDWKERFADKIPKIEGITTAYSYRMQRDEYSGDVMLYHKKTMDLPEWEGCQVFVPAHSLDELPEPKSESPRTDKHDSAAAEMLARLPKECPMCFREEDVCHAIELHTGSYQYLPHESELSKLPRFKLDESEPVDAGRPRSSQGSQESGKELKASLQPGTKNSARLRGTALIGESASSNCEDRDIWNRMRGKDLRYSKPADVRVGQRSAGSSRIYSKRLIASSDGRTWKVSSLAQLRLDELPSPQTFAFIRCEGGLDQCASDCPAIALIVKAPAWRGVCPEGRENEELEVVWYSVDPKMLQKHGAGALSRAALCPLVDPQATGGNRKKSKKLWASTITAASLLAWNVSLTKARTLTKASLDFLRVTLGVQGLEGVERTSSSSSETGVDLPPAGASVSQCNLWHMLSTALVFPGDKAIFCTLCRTTMKLSPGWTGYVRQGWLAPLADMDWPQALRRYTKHLEWENCHHADECTIEADPSRNRYNNVYPLVVIVDPALKGRRAAEVVTSGPAALPVDSFPGAMRQVIVELRRFYLERSRLPISPKPEGFGMFGAYIQPNLGRLIVYQRMRHWAPADFQGAVFTLDDNKSPFDDRLGLALLKRAVELEELEHGSSSRVGVEPERDVVHWGGTQLSD
ncbi:hypothetical protein FOZ62_019068, partial [Perkinsus olseni]